MATIANLDVNLFARTSKFDKPLDMSRKKFGGFKSSVSKGGSVISGAFSAFAGGAAAGFAIFTAAAAAATTVVFKLAGSINELDQELEDFSRFGLSKDSFGQFEVLASGAKVEVDKLADATKDLGIRIGEASRDGKGEIFDIFGQLKLDVKELEQLKPEQQLEKFSDAISQVSDANERLTITDILLSDAGTDVLKLFEKGSGVFADARKQADELGLSLNDLQISRIDDAANAFTDFNLALKGLGRQLSADFAFEIKLIFNAFTNGLKDAIALTKTLSIAWNEFRLFFIDTVASTIKSFEKLAELAATFGEFNFLAGLQGQSELFRAFALQALNEINTEIDNLGNKANSVLAKVNRLKPSGGLQFGSQAASTAFLNDRDARNQDIVVKAINEGSTLTVDELIKIRRSLQRRGVLTVVDL